MSHHLDTPFARQNGQLYIDDFYVFSGEHGTVFVMDVNRSQWRRLRPLYIQQNAKDAKLLSSKMVSCTSDKISRLVLVMAKLSSRWTCKIVVRKPDHSVQRIE